MGRSRLRWSMAMETLKYLEGNEESNDLKAAHRDDHET